MAPTSNSSTSASARGVGRDRRRRVRKGKRVRRELERRSSRARRRAVYCERARTVGKRTGRRRSIFLITLRVQPGRLGRFSRRCSTPFLPLFAIFSSPANLRLLPSLYRAAFITGFFLLFKTVVTATPVARAAPFLTHHRLGGLLFQR